ncbi:hypothetical protein MsAg5_05300 [Methanosarcinaceae archaeon Ag5]|uniref:GLUG domain-containing protein n=1 Tax=Methanolapillus africanus TaxID=3028297 RepID=A0AAE4SEU7_9EURY|nr:hypothetical protein [Methanosarcinaceae archaeon Ag5]
MDSKEKTTYHPKKKHVSITVALLLLLFISSSLVYIQDSNAGKTAICDCEEDPAAAEFGFEQQPTVVPKNNLPVIPVTPTDGGGNDNSKDNPPPAPAPISDVPIIATTELFDYNQDNAKTLRLILTANDPGLQITNLSASYKNVNDASDSGTISLSSAHVDATYGTTGTYLISIPAAGNPLSRVGDLNTYEYSFAINDGTGVSTGSCYPFQSGTGQIDRDSNNNITATTPFEIQNIVQLDALRYYTQAQGDGANGKIFAVTQDIALPADWNNNSEYNRAQTNGKQWIPIGGNDNAFCGYLDGSNKTLSHFKVETAGSYSGLFGIIGGPNPNSKPEIKNIVIENMTVNATSSYAGLFAGNAQNARMENLHVNGTVRGVGGVGGMTGGLNNSSLANSSFKGTVTGTGNQVGGLTGRMDGDTLNGKGCNISNSTSTANVFGGGNFTGGLVGLNLASYSGCFIKDSTVTGDIITDYVPTTNYGVYVGGIAGHIGPNNGPGDGFTIDNCTYTGNITGINVSYMGGIVGATSGYHYPQKIINSKAIGNITGTGSRGASHIGGVGGTISNAIVENSFANVNVSGGDQLGGLAGSIHNTSVSNSYTAGNVTGTEWLGGFVGNLGGDGSARSEITNCYATGDVTGGKVVEHRARFGGFAGSITNATVENCYASGNVTGLTAPNGGSSAGSTVGTGGLAGLVHDNVTLKNCTALNGDIKLLNNNVHQNLGRIYGLESHDTGGNYGENHISGNYAYENMTLTVNTISNTATADDGTGTGGFNMTKTQAKDAAFYENTLGWKFNDADSSKIIWKIGDGGYPLPVLTWPAANQQPIHPPAWATA